MAIYKRPNLTPEECEAVISTIRANLPDDPLSRDFEVLYSALLKLNRSGKISTDKKAPE
jgi:hypothetical protein